MAEDAMTRERALEDAAIVLDSRVRDLRELYDKFELADGVAAIARDLRRALAVAQPEPAPGGIEDDPVQYERKLRQIDINKVFVRGSRAKPAPSADAEEVADDIYAIAWDAYMDAIAATDHRPPSSSGLRAALTAALRRYAGDGGATEEQVEAGARVLAAQRGHKNLAEPIRCVGNTTRAVWQFYCDDARQILETAARAKSSEKGGAR